MGSVCVWERESVRERGGIESSQESENGKRKKEVKTAK